MKGVTPRWIPFQRPTVQVSLGLCTFFCFSNRTFDFGAVVVFGTEHVCTFVATKQKEPKSLLVTIVFATLRVQGHPTGSHRELCLRGKQKRWSGREPPLRRFRRSRSFSVETVCRSDFSTCRFEQAETVGLLSLSRFPICRVSSKVVFVAVVMAGWGKRHHCSSDSFPRGDDGHNHQLSQVQAAQGAKV